MFLQVNGIDVDDDSRVRARLQLRFESLPGRDESAPGDGFDRDDGRGDNEPRSLNMTSTRQVLVIGGGPAGAVAGRELARAGRDVVVLEAAHHPRFHVGESFLPRTMLLLDELGLAGVLGEVPAVVKHGAEFVMGHGDDEPSEIWFRDALGGPSPPAVNLARAPFDRALAAAARAAGAEVREGVRVRGVERLADGDVRVATDDGPLQARWLLDASGQATVVARHLGTRRVLEHHRKIATFTHMTGVWRHHGEREGFITVVMCDEGWFWIIPLDAATTSVGVVLDRAAVAAAGVAPRAALEWAIPRCPVMTRRCAGASAVIEPRVEADFSYVCRPYAGAGHFLLGDAAVFLDPVFSTGVCLGMVAAAAAAGAVDRLLDGADPAAERARYERLVSGSSTVFFRFVEHFYDPAFRDLFLEAEGPLGVHRAAVGVLAGHVFPRPPFTLRWRLRLLETFVAVQRHAALVRRRRGHSLLAACRQEAA